MTHKARSLNTFLSSADYVLYINHVCVCGGADGIMTNKYKVAWKILAISYSYKTKANFSKYMIKNHTKCFTEL